MYISFEFVTSEGQHKPWKFQSNLRTIFLCPNSILPFCRSSNQQRKRFSSFKNIAVYCAHIYCSTPIPGGIGSFSFGRKRNGFGRNNYNVAIQLMTFCFFKADIHVLNRTKCIQCRIGFFNIFVAIQGFRINVGVLNQRIKCQNYFFRGYQFKIPEM